MSPPAGHSRQPPAQDLGPDLLAVVEMMADTVTRSIGSAFHGDRAALRAAVAAGDGAQLQAAAARAALAIQGFGDQFGVQLAKEALRRLGAA